MNRIARIALIAMFAATAAVQNAAAQLSPTQIESVRTDLERLAPAPGAGLMTGVPQREGVERALSSVPGVGRTRTVAIRADYLNAVMTGPALQLREGRLSDDAKAYQIDLFDDVTVRVAKIDMVRDVLGHDVWRGALLGSQDGEVTLVIDNGAITGRVRIGAKNYGIQPAANGLHTVIEYDESKMPIQEDDTRRPEPRPELDLKTAPPQMSPTAVDSPERAKAVTSLNMLVVYTPRALQLRPNITSDISLFVSRLNTALANSAANVQINLVGTNQVAYTETSTSTKSVILDAATDGLGDFARIAQVRASLQADIVHVLPASTDGCGVAWINDHFERAGTNLAYYARNVTGVTQVDAAGSCIASGQDSHVHEVGHNLGASHDRGVTSSAVAGPQGYNYGYVDLSVRTRTIMAYNDVCNNQGFFCSRILYFSNPDISYQGRPTGVPVAQATAANNARRISEIAPYVAQVRGFLNAPRLQINMSGTGTVSGSSISCTSSCANTVTAGQTIILTATPAAGRSFSSWSGDCVSSTTSSTGGTCTVVANGWAYVSATFSTAAPTSYSLTVAKAGTGAGTVTSSPSGISCGSTCSASYASGTSVTLTAAPSSGSTFAGWSNGCSGTATTCTVSMSAARSVTATFNLTQAATQSLSLTITGSGTVASAPSGINCSASCTGSFTTGAQVVLSATPGTGGTFTGWSGGGCSGTGTCTVTMSAAASVTAAFSQAQSQTQTVLLNVTGSGTVTSSPSGFNCRSECSASFTSGASIILTASPSQGWIFAGWGSVCPGTDTCTITASAGRTVTATFIQPSGTTVSMGSVYTTSQSAIQSFLRLFNTSSTDGVVQVTLVSDASGASVGQWTSPSIPAGASRQFSLDEIERGTGATFTRPSNYTLLLQSQITGYAQHVLYRPSDGTLTNLSTCSTGVTANPTQLINVHSTILDSGFPSTVVVNNTGAAQTTFALGVYDSITGAKLGNGNYSTVVAAGGQSRVAVQAMEQSLGISPATSGLYHYNVKIEGSSNGFLQHLVNNSRVGVITDMTTTCSLSPLTASRPSALRLSSVYSTTQNTTQSFLRFHNTSTSAGTVRMTLGSATTGSTLATWTSPTIAAGASRQFSMSEIETGASQAFTKPANYSITVQPNVNGYVQHVLYRPADGTLTNVSTCDAGIGIEASQLINVHTGLLGGNFPSTVVVSNTGTSATNVSLGVYDATTGAKLGNGNYAVLNVPANGQTRVLMTTIESTLGINPAPQAIYHYVVKAETTLTGYLTHLVNNAQVGVITDMTTVCGMNSDDVSPDSIATSGAIALSAATAGTLDFSTDTDWFRVSVTGGASYRIDLQGSASNAGTLTDPFLTLRDSNGSIVASDDDSGVGFDSSLTFTASGSGTQTYYLVASGYEGATGTYRMTIAPAPTDDFTPDSTATNGTATAGSEQSGTLSPTGDRDWFRISLTAGTAYTVDLMGLSSGRGTLTDPYLRVMNSSGTQVAFNDDKSTGCCDSQLSYTPTTSGTYYLVAGSYNDASTGTYVISARGSTVVASTPVRIEGTYGFNITYGSTATLRADRIVNNSTTQTSGTLRLELWYFSQPYVAGISGYKLAQATLGQLTPGASLTSVSQTVTPLTTPPSGVYYQAFLLTEYNSTNCSAADRYCVIDSVTFSTPLTKSDALADGESTDSALSYNRPLVKNPKRGASEKVAAVD